MFRRFDDDATNKYGNVWDRMLKEGKHYTEIDVPLSLRIREQNKFKNQQCFQNAQKLAQDGYQYVEGFAVCIIPTEHAWCVDPKHPDVIIDPTWAALGHDDAPDYFGVSIPLTFIHKCQLVTEQYAPVIKPWMFRDHPDINKKTKRGRMLYWL